MDIIVYERHQNAARATVKWLTDRNVPHDIVDMTTVPNLSQFFIEMGMTGSHVVAVNNAGGVSRWESFRPDLLATYCAEVDAA